MLPDIVCYQGLVTLFIIGTGAMVGGAIVVEVVETTGIINIIHITIDI